MVMPQKVILGGDKEVTGNGGNGEAACEPAGKLELSIEPRGPDPKRRRN